MKTTIKILSITISLILLASLQTGCVERIMNTPEGKIVSITQRGIGFVIDQSPTTESPEVKFGFFSSAVVIEPTSTNAPIYSPNFANTFDFSQAGALQLGIGENFSSGNYATYQAGGTNSAPTTQPVSPH
jgi:hypothetical protein